MLRSVELVELTIESGLKLPSLEGRFFCSRRDPKREAQSWVQSHSRILQTSNRLVILGLGAGFHIEALPENLEIQVIELRPELIQYWSDRHQNSRVKFVEPTSQSLDGPVLEFRPAWSGLDSSYEEISRNLRQVHRSSLQIEADRKDLWILSEALQTSQLPENLELTIKDIVSLIPIENQSEEARLWRALRELVA